MKKTTRFTKKIIFAALLAILSLALFSCVAAPTVTQLNEKNITGVTYEGVAGTYILNDASDSRFDVDKYAVNSLVLNSDGSFALEISTAASSNHKTDGKYTVSDNGVVVLDGGKTALVSVGEKIVCDGKTLTAQGTIGTAVTLKYKKALAE